MRELSDFERNLVDLVHFLSFGSQKDCGLTLKEVHQFLNKPLRDHKGLTPIDLVQKSGSTFLNDLKTFINEHEGS